MSKMYTDYTNMTAITIPDQFIDVKTGDSQLITAKMQEQIEYHTHNQTLLHLLLSALNSYLHPKIAHEGTKEILAELSEIKEMMMQTYSTPSNYPIKSLIKHNPKTVSAELNMKDVEDILEIFGG
ncbi:hypothetical protein [Niallia sp. NCCP-28]|uniref:hypothetical protein n=1 Tax=Niallia sp. NCCP-28 TaxID=2934712 RepID=UPI0020860ACF|nr:hypothetical protein [Niallia sp. NCCP-28]GKU80710.1 hypothetical protein NCCP28_01060 [Niallia sp. NCCP-28]